MKKYVSNDSTAENEGGVHLSRKKFELIQNNLRGLSFFQKLRWNKNFDRTNEILMYGDTQPAMVVTLNPLIISAYSDEMDAVALLDFPTWLGDLYDLKEGERLVTSNVYWFVRGRDSAPNLIIGENYLGRYADFTPVVQLFLAEEEEYSRGRVNLFTEERWGRVRTLTEERLGKYSWIPPRNGFFYFFR